MCRDVETKYCPSRLCAACENLKAASWCARTCTRHRPPLRSAGRLLLLTRSHSHLLFGDHVTGLAFYDQINTRKTLAAMTRPPELEAKSGRLPCSPFHAARNPRPRCAKLLAKGRPGQRTPPSRPANLSTLPATLIEKDHSPSGRQRPAPQSGLQTRPRVAGWPPTHPTRRPKGRRPSLEERPPQSGKVTSKRTSNNDTSGLSPQLASRSLPSSAVEATARSSCEKETGSVDPIPQ